jgi:putative transcriptional regulator
MADVRFVLDPTDPPRRTAHEAVAADALTDAAITEAARADPDNPPLTTEELDRIALARRVKRVRTDLGLSQEAFAARYGIPVATLRQWEMGRRAPDRATLSYLQVIARLPEQVAEALAAA